MLPSTREEQQMRGVVCVCVSAHDCKLLKNSTDLQRKLASFRNLLLILVVIGFMLLKRSLPLFVIRCCQTKSNYETDRIICDYDGQKFCRFQWRLFGYSPRSVSVSSLESFSPLEACTLSCDPSFRTDFHTENDCLLMTHTLHLK